MQNDYTALIARGCERERLAIAMFDRDAPSHIMDWEFYGNKERYLCLADAVLSTLGEKEVSDLRKRIIEEIPDEDETMSTSTLADAVSAKPSQAEARLASLRQRATDLANDLEAAGYHGFAFGAQKIANIAARGSNEAAPSNTLRERIAGVLWPEVFIDDVDRDEAERSCGALPNVKRREHCLKRVDAVLALLDEKEVK